MSILIQRFLKIDRREVQFERRGFVCANPVIQARLENIGGVFLQGYHAAFQEADQSVLTEKLNQVDQEQRGFAYEGAAMALALMDEISFRGNAFSRFVAGSGKQHIFMLHVGAGWAYARLPWMRWHIESAIRKLHPVLRWLVIDGYGFHEGYFHFKAQLQSGSSPAARFLRLSYDARHVFYQGLGRSLWFVNGADVQEISASIARFPSLYHGDAWSGVGLACAYAGGITQEAIVNLRQQAGIYASALAQGAAFAAKARQLAGNPAQHTEVACAVLCQMHSEEAAALCDATFSQIDLLLPCPYQHWRELLQKSLSSSSENLIRGKSHESSVSSSLVATKSH
jgi:enediyne biosynthesis protein E3